MLRLEVPQLRPKTGAVPHQEAALLVTVDVPDGVKLDGAVVELSVRGGQVAAEVRIPAKD